MAVKMTESGEKLPALSELIGEILPFPAEGEAHPDFRRWRRPLSKDGATEDIILMSTDAACQFLDVSPETLNRWANREKPGIRAAYGWWASAALISWAAERQKFDRRGR